MEKSNQAIDRVSEGEDVIDSRDVISAIDDLRTERDSAKEEGREFDDAELLSALEKLQEEAAGYSPDWTYGATLIRDSYFEEYAQELAEDIGAIDKHAQWPNTCIDWGQAAHELQQDYTSVEFGSTTYWVR